MLHYEISKILVNFKLGINIFKLSELITVLNLTEKVVYHHKNTTSIFVTRNQTIELYYKFII